MAGRPVPFLTGIDLFQTELRNAKIQNLASDPANPVEGQVYFNTTIDLLKTYDGTSWQQLGNLRFRRAYNATRDYSNGDAVTYSGSTYVMVADAPAGTLPTDTDFWALLAEGGMMSTYTNATPMPVAVGGFGAGTTFNARPQQDMWTGLLYPYQNPGFSGFTMSGQATAVEVGTTLSGLKSFTWNVSNPSNVAPNSISLYQGTATGTPLVSGLSANSTSTTATINSIVNNTPGTQVWTLKGTNTKGTDFTTTFQVAWQYKKYYGNSSNQTLTGAEVLALSDNSLGVTSAGNYSFSAGEYKYIAVPVAWTAPNAIKDQATLLEVALENKNPYTNGTTAKHALVNVTNSNGITAQYRVYRSENKLNTNKVFVVS